MISWCMFWAANLSIASISWLNRSLTPRSLSSRSEISFFFVIVFTAVKKIFHFRWRAPSGTLSLSICLRRSFVIGLHRSTSSLTAGSKLEGDAPAWPVDKRKLASFLWKSATSSTSRPNSTSAGVVP